MIAKNLFYVPFQGMGSTTHSWTGDTNEFVEHLALEFDFMGRVKYPSHSDISLSHNILSISTRLHPLGDKPQTNSLERRLDRSAASPLPLLTALRVAHETEVAINCRILDCAINSESTVFVGIIRKGSMIYVVPGT